MVLFAMVTLISCDGEDDVIEYLVVFDTGDGGTEVPDQTIENGDKVTRPDDPVRDGYAFTGEWMNGTFPWDFDLDIVTENLTLVAGWLELTFEPSEIEMSDEVFSSTVVWRQTDADLADFEVSLKADGESTYVPLAGTVEIDDANVMNIVTFTPDHVPTGGIYTVKVNASGIEREAEGLLFGGEGSEANPYLVSKVSDMVAILENNQYHQAHFLQINDLLGTVTDPLEINDARKISFGGVYDGGNHAVQFSGNGGLFHHITEAGVVRNVVVDGATALFASETNLYAIGAIANENDGLIENISSRALISNARMQGALPVYDGVDTEDLSTGAGSIVGLNGLTGTVRNVTVGGAGAVKAGRGSGGVAAYNFGLIEGAVVTATLPAGNQANSGKSSNTYAYGGGIAGFNFGTIREASVTGRVFAQSAYSEEGVGNEGKNVAFGGIAGYNEGIIIDSSFSRNLSMKEFIDKSRSAELGDSANNLGVASIHGDLYVGGIAGINNGMIENVYVGGALIAARDFAGGITGLSLAEGMITNAYVFAEVTTKDDGGLVTTANAKTTATTYEIAPSGFDPDSTVFKRLLNSDSEETWVPGDFAEPKLPMFEAADLAKVGNGFALSGVLLWQTGNVTGVDIVLDEVVLPFGATEQLEYTVSPSTAPDQHTTWTSSDESIVLVHADGTIEGIGEGTATISVTTRDGGFTDTINVTVLDYVHVDSVIVTSPDVTLPTPNNIDDRPEITIGTIIVFELDILPLDAEYPGYTLSSSNSRAVVDGDTVTFVFGATGPGNVSITVTFEDSSVESLEYRFRTVEGEPVDVPITDVTITSPEITLPDANNAEDRDPIEIGTVITLDIDILPINASNQNYLVTTSNSRAEANGNEITFVYGNTGPGSVSVKVIFEDTSVGVNGLFEYRFTTVEAEEQIPVTDVLIESPEILLPNVNDITDRMEIEIGTVINLLVTLMPEGANVNTGYTVTTSNSRAQANDHQVTFVTGLTGPGSVSIKVIFDDTTLGNDGVFEFRFTTVEPPAEVGMSDARMRLMVGQNELKKPLFDRLIW